eukprot:31081-Pelagococcus_subviridis.AAC.8
MKLADVEPVVRRVLARLARLRVRVRERQRDRARRRRRRGFDRARPRRALARARVRRGRRPRRSVGARLRISSRVSRADSGREAHDPPRRRDAEERAREVHDARDDREAQERGALRQRPRRPRSPRSPRRVPRRHRAHRSIDLAPEARRVAKLREVPIAYSERRVSVHRSVDRTAVKC